jgi:hypothetical protein
MGKRRGVSIMRLEQVRSIPMLRQFNLDWRKAVTFAVWGAIGGTAGSIIGETIDHDGSSRTIAQILWDMGLWFGIMGALIALALLCAQIYYLHRFLRFQKTTFTGTALGFIAGAVAGAIAQFVYSVIGPTEVLRVICWGIAGGLLGASLSFRIPNLGCKRGFCGGLFGGIIGGCLFILFSVTLTQVLGRMIGVGAIGFFIGLMIIFAESAFREAWLEIGYGGNEKRTVSLGSTPVLIGSDGGRCTVFARDVPPVACAYTLEQGRVVFYDEATGQTQNLKAGDRRQIGNIQITVCAAGGDIQSKHLPDSSSGTLSLFLPKGKTVLLAVGTKLARTEFPELDFHSSEGNLAEVRTSPSDASILGLTNLSGQTWSAVMPDGSCRRIDPGRSVRLAKGTIIDFGKVKGEVR